MGVNARGLRLQPDHSLLHGRRHWTASIFVTVAVCFGITLGAIQPDIVSIPWSLDRIDQRTLPLDGRFIRPGDGTGVHAYVVDTGLRKTHREFGDRADWVGDFVGGSPASLDAHDCDPPGAAAGHGTHVAGVLGGTEAGVAPGARLHALRILPCNGTTRTDFQAAVRAVEWITAHGVKPAVVNISPARASTDDRALDEAVRRSIEAGFVYVFSAGGVEGIADYSPQRVEEAIKVGSTDMSDRALQNKYGRALTLFAPGVKIPAAGSADDTAMFVDDGDSYASALVAGVVAVYLQHHPAARPAEVKRALTDGAVRGAVANAGNAPNLLVQIID